jgi:hypothetical protein
MKCLSIIVVAIAANTTLITTTRVYAEMTARPIATGELNHPYVGLWVTADGHIRHRLLPNGRYDEARGSQESAYRGRYEIRGSRIEYWDDTGFTADGEFIEGVLHHAGMILLRRE